MRKQIPSWIINAVGVGYRFVAGAFGVDLPHPWRAGLCGPFWGTVIGCTAGIPFVLLGWIIRLLFGKGRALAFTNTLGGACNAFSRTRTWWFLTGALKSILIGVPVAFLFGGILSGFGMLLLIGALVIAGPLAVIMILFVVLSAVDEKLYERSLKKAHTEKTQGPPRSIPFLNGLWNLVRWCAAVIFWIPKHALLVIWQVLVFAGSGIIALYRRACPIAEFP